jgi:2-keto-4-pentenoate hydratase
MNDRAGAVSQQLLDVRKTGQRLHQLPEALVPPDLLTAYEIQDAIIGGEPVGGWKIAAGVGIEPLCSPLFASAYHASGAVLDVGQAMATIAEAEVAVRIGSDLPPREEPYSETEVAEAIASLHPSLEILGSRFLDSKSVPPLLAIADLQSNAAIVVGPPLTDWQGLDLSSLHIDFKVGAKAASVDRGASNDETVGAIAWLANTRAHSHGGLRKGQVIITGSRINAPITASDETVIADFGPLGTVTLYLA